MTHSESSSAALAASDRAGLAVSVRVLARPSGAAIALIATGLAALVALWTMVSVAFAATLNVDTNDAGCDDVTGTPFCTIQAAVDAAAAGDTVTVAAGSYDEQVAISKALSIDGAGVGVTIIVPTSAANNSTHVASAIPVAALVLVEDTTGVALNSLTIDGAIAGFGACAQGFYGIFYRNASGSITDVEVDNIIDPAAVGCQQALAVSVQSGGGASASVTISSSTAENYGKAGISCLGASTICNADGNTLVGRGPVSVPHVAQNGIDLASGATGTIEDNDVSQHFFNPQTVCATAISINGDSAVVRGNTLSGNFCDITLEGDAGTVEGNLMPVAANFALQIIGDNNVISTNLISGSPGLAVYNDGVGNSYDCNRVVNNDFGFLFDSLSGPGTPNALNMNAILGNLAGVDASVVAAPPLIDAENNWWGASDGPSDAGGSSALGSGDSVTTKVDFAPYLTAPAACVPCTVNADCSDGAACSGMETCNGVTSTCDPGTPVVCSGECLTGGCVEPSGTCQVVPDGSLCGAGGGCDVCLGGSCVADGAPDADADGVCDLQDNCPSDANSNQSDVDSDGVGDVCDAEDAPGSMVLSRVKLRADKPNATNPKGKLRIITLVNDDIAGNFLPDDLKVAGDVFFTITAGAFAATIDMKACLQQNSRKIRCNNGDVHALFRLVPQGGNVFPNTYKAVVKQKRIADEDQPTVPVVITLEQPTSAIDRVDDIAACTERPRRLSCRER